MRQPAHYAAIVIGSGQAGGPLAADLAAAGWKTALVERDHLGGTCVNVGCTPTKTMVASARVAYLVRRAADYGVRTGRIAVDMAKVRKRKREIVRIFGGVTPDKGPKKSHLQVLYGEAKFTGPKSIEVSMSKGGARQLTGDTIFINTGARPSRPAIPGLADVEALDSTSIMELDSLPDHLLVLGGGYIGVEFGQMFRRFGSRVTIVQRAEALLAREDPDVAEAVASILRDDGVDVLLGAEVRLVARGGKGRIHLSVRQKGRSRRVAGTHLLLAAGRQPNTEELNLEAAGIARDEKGYVVVDERLETRVPDVYALGDVKGGPAFTHISYDDYRLIRTNLLEGGRATTKDRLVPYTIYMDPELGRVGLSETEAMARGLEVRVAKLRMDAVARALERDEPRGFIKIIVDSATDQILGCAVLGIEGGEIMSMLQIAMMGHVPSTVLREAIFAHPTLAESLNNVFHHFQNQPGRAERRLAR
jgi:pyruvate/2-oxoglutarate dehydrogenase complex dihydrolipoamide dehydrogenase (E3) component